MRDGTSEDAPDDSSWSTGGAVWGHRVNGDDVLRARLANHQLVAPSATSAADLVRHMGAVQAQDYPGARWALGCRLPGLTDAEVERAFDAGEILRTHILRPTWHLVAPEDLRWMQRLTAPHVRRILQGYDRRLGLDPDLLRRATEIVLASLAGRTYLSRAEIQARLAADGVHFVGQALGHVLMHAELDALICSGPRRGSQFTYALVDERAAGSDRDLRGDDALAELTRRYFSSHGPATVADFAWWSGLRIGDVRRGIAALENETATVRIGDRTYYWLPRSIPPMPSETYLLPNYDEFTVAYRDRDLYFDPRAAADVAPRLPRGTTMRSQTVAVVPFDHAIVWGGRVIGLWRRVPRGDAIEVSPILFPGEKADGEDGIVAAAERYRGFLGREVRLLSPRS